MTDSKNDHSANPGYVLGQLAKALATGESHADPEACARAQAKAEKWAAIFAGMLSGNLQVGSRTPVTSVPGWATLEVAPGGFATGTLLAGGPLLPHEEVLLQRLASRLPEDSDQPAAGRALLNTYYLTEAGLGELRDMLQSGCYRVNVPEEGALLVVAWLVEHGHAETARALLDELGSFFPKLRFYPAPAAQPLAPSSMVHVNTVRQMIRELEDIRQRERVLTMREALQVWNPIYDEVVQLFLETVEGPLPSLRTVPDGKPERDKDRRFSIEGGWPCQSYPDGWRERARDVLRRYQRARAKHTRSGKPERAKENFPRLRAYLQRCIDAPAELTGADVGRIRLILAGIVNKRGAPGSQTWQALRQAQQELASCPTKRELSRVVIGRLKALPQDSGLTTLAQVIMPVDEREAARHTLKTGQPISEPLKTMLLRCVDAPVEALVEQGIIPSGEVLAAVIPQITSQIAAAGVAHPTLRLLYGAIYAAFRKRRSLLLLNLESQIKIHELPWVKAIDAHRGQSLQARESARQTLEDVVTLAITAFPHMILPNKLITELRALAQSAKLQIPLVEEVAADIFMHAFTEKFLQAAQKAGEMLKGTLYETYYGIPYDRVLSIGDLSASRYGAVTSTTFYSLCCELAGYTTPTRRFVAYNGIIIEQEQIMTTHNLAVLFDALDLTARLGPRLSDLAQHCFTWICQRLQMSIKDWRPRLHMIKNTAYAWRQMIFYLALMSRRSPASVDAFLRWAREHAGAQSPAFQTRFWPALLGLMEAADGRPPTSGQARRFLGWTTEKHWLLA